MIWPIFKALHSRLCAQNKQNLVFLLLKLTDLEEIFLIRVTKLNRTLAASGDIVLRQHKVPRGKTSGNGISIQPKEELLNC